MKYLLTALTISTLLTNALPSLGTKSSNLYLPNDQFCAIYEGKINDEQTFPLWIEKKRQLTIKIDGDLKIALIYNDQIVPPYQINTLSDTYTAQYAFVTSSTGNHLITLRGKTQTVKITFCVR